jgi:hypothetical protein
MKTLRQQHEELNNKVNEQYDILIDKVGGINFYDVCENEEDEDLSDYENVSIINRNGNSMDVRVLEISKNSGVYVAKDEDESQRFWIGLNELGSLYDKITIVELLTEYL